MSAIREKPLVSFALSLAGGILILIDAILLILLSTLFLTSVVIYDHQMINMTSLNPLFIIIPLIGIICSAVVIFGSILINTGDHSKVRLGGILVVIFSVISIIAGGGFLIGLILGLVGGILALVWKPKDTATQQ
jgi:uncharacterized membrane protein YjjP (DUF1212 family)